MIFLDGIDVSRKEPSRLKSVQQCNITETNTIPLYYSGQKRLFEANAHPIRMQAVFLNSLPERIFHFASGTQSLLNILYAIFEENQVTHFIVESSFDEHIIKLIQNHSNTKIRLFRSGNFNSVSDEILENAPDGKTVLIIHQLCPFTGHAVSLKKLIKKCTQKEILLILDSSSALGLIPLPKEMPGNCFLIIDPYFSGTIGAQCMCIKYGDNVGSFNKIAESIRQDYLSHDYPEPNIIFPDPAQIGTQFLHYKKEASKMQESLENGLTEASVSWQYVGGKPHSPFIFSIYTNAGNNQKNLGELLYLNGIYAFSFSVNKAGAHCLTGEPAFSQAIRICFRRENNEKEIEQIIRVFQKLLT